ncbi:Protein CBG00181 [Caenorhabditis briggsae]|uniref:Protein CBG00181 n=1 Tax=Caenorhabditis briggsae TaxID=6238 RepID=A8WMF2_CAEBR|nr:Protein CBG00181 [Caenorhabditis briggsae]CAP21657.2 Protein CBG00181 [Caenorhabditis briggsae]
MSATTSPSSSNNIPKSQSCEEIPDINQRRRHPSLGFLEVSTGRGCDSSDNPDRRGHESKEKRRRFNGR